MQIQQSSITFPVGRVGVQPITGCKRNTTEVCILVTCLQEPPPHGDLLMTSFCQSPGYTGGCKEKWNAVYFLEKCVHTKLFECFGKARIASRWSPLRA